MIGTLFGFGQTVSEEFNNKHCDTTVLYYIRYTYLLDMLSHIVHDLT